MPTDSPLLTAALAYAARGWALFPCAPRSGRDAKGKEVGPKRPLIERGLHAASCDPNQIRAWWKRWPDALIATPTGRAIGHWVLDIDVHRGAPGLASLAAWEDEHGALPDTAMVITASGGRHFLFRYPAAPTDVVTRGKLAPGIDTRGAGGYVIVPPSVSEDGTWRWGEHSDPADGIAIADAPPWLLALACAPLASTKPAPAQTAAAPDGARSFFAKVNTKSLARLADWVPTLFPGATRYREGYRVTSKALGRDLEEDLSILPQGIQDFGEERGSAYGTRGLTPIDLVMEWGAPTSARDAALWLCDRIGADPAALGWRGEGPSRPPAPPPATSAPPAPAPRHPVADPPQTGWSVALDEHGDLMYPDEHAPPPALDAPPAERGQGSEPPPPPPPPSGPPAGDSGGRHGGRPAWAERLMYTEKGAIQATAYNVRLILEHLPEWQGVLGWCEFSQRPIARKTPPLANAPRGEWTDAHDAALQYWLADRFRFEAHTDKIATAVIGVAMAHAFHPVREYLDRLVWDRRERLPTWLMTLMGAGRAEDDPALSDQQRADLDRYLSLVGVWWMVQSIARIRVPGCKADTVLILEGDQGIKKSSALQALYSKEFSTDTRIDFANKDAMLSMAGIWLIELPELEGMNKADARTLKAFISSGEDRFRLPYGHRLGRFPRQSVMAGTTNQAEIFRDLTGNRRYWPVACGAIDMEGLIAERDQLWAEAQARYARGEAWWAESPEDKALVEEQQGDRVAGDVWENRIQSFLAGRLVGERPDRQMHHFVSLDSIMGIALGFDLKDIKPPDWTRAGQLVHALGWRATRPTVDGNRVRGYRPGPKVLKRLEEAATLAQRTPGEVDDGPLW